tara:strand:- start:3061 stop:3735 length:675 start_codon:yes stop_codon:yes gene_type:complete
MATVGEAISRVRNVLKAVKEDPFLTDRLIYSLIMKVAKTLIKRDDRVESLFKYKSLFKELPCVELIEVDKVEACCIGIKTGCTIKRTKYKIPKLMQVGDMQVIRSVTTLDYSKKATQTYPTVYTNMTHTSGFKYNKQKYYWFLDGYLYIPDVLWESIRLQAIFDEDIEDVICSTEPGECTKEQDRELSIPEHLFTEIEQMVVQQILTAGQIPSDGPDDSQNVIR